LTDVTSWNRTDTQITMPLHSTLCYQGGQASKAMAKAISSAYSGCEPLN
jgi:hypothetical protein